MSFKVELLRSQKIPPLRMFYVSRNIIVIHKSTMGILSASNKLSNYAFCQFIFFLLLAVKATLATFGGHRHFWAIALWLTPDDPCMAFDPMNALHSVQGVFLPNLVAKGHS